MPGSPSRVTAARRLGGLAQLLGDRVELGAPPDDRARRPAELDRERALGPDERVERTAVGNPGARALLGGRRLVQHAPDYDLATVRPRSRDLMSRPQAGRRTSRATARREA